MGTDEFPGQLCSCQLSPPTPLSLSSHQSWNFSFRLNGFHLTLWKKSAKAPAAPLTCTNPPATCFPSRQPAPCLPLFNLRRLDVLSCWRMRAINRLRWQKCASPFLTEARCACTTVKEKVMKWSLVHLYELRKFVLVITQTPFAFNYNHSFKKTSSYRHKGILHPTRQASSSWCKTSSPPRTGGGSASPRRSPFRPRPLRRQLTAAGAPRPGAAWCRGYRWNWTYACL